MPEPTPAQRLRLDLVVVQKKLAAMRREVDEALAAGPITAEVAAGFAMRLQSLQQSVWRLGRDVRALSG